MRKRSVHFFVVVAFILLLLAQKHFVSISGNAVSSIVEQFLEAINFQETPTHKLPQIIGIGSKKCGTAAFRRFLSFHSRVHVLSNGETHFFDKGYKKGIEYYKNLMPATKGRDITFEKTPNYFVNKDVPERIKETYAMENVSTPKFVLVVCDPVQRAYSDFVHGVRSNYSKPHNFDDYIKLAFKAFAEISPFYEDIQSFYKRIDILYKKHLPRTLLRGVYSYFLQHWYKYFPSKDFLIIDGGKLLTNPGEVMLKAQMDLGLEVEIRPEHFVFLREKGFFCIRTSGNPAFCLNKSKGRTRKVENNGTVTQTNLSINARYVLEDFYRPFNEHFNQLTQTHIL